MTKGTLTFVRFLFVGGSFSLIYSVTTALLINFAGAPPFLTSVILYLICIPLAFWAQRNFAFRSPEIRENAFVIYAATQVAGFMSVSFITTKFITYQPVWDTAILIGTVGLTAVVSFLIGKFAIFRP